MIFIDAVLWLTYLCWRSVSDHRNVALHGSLKDEAESGTFKCSTASVPVSVFPLVVHLQCSYLSNPDSRAGSATTCAAKQQACPSTTFYLTLNGNYRSVKRANTLDQFEMV